MTFTVVYDANVLYPNTLRDLLIRIAQSPIGDRAGRLAAEFAAPTGPERLAERHVGSASGQSAARFVAVGVHMMMLRTRF
jgi:hypothetical protein